MEGLNIRAMREDDLPEVLTLESACSATPWSRKSFTFELQNPHSLLITAECDGKIIGFVCFRTTLDSTSLMNLAVSPAYRLRGVGTLLLDKGLRILARKWPEATFVTLEVRESNRSAILLYERSGFRKSGLRKEYYRKPSENALIMERPVQPAGNKHV